MNEASNILPQLVANALPPSTQSEEAEFTPATHPYYDRYAALLARLTRFDLEKSSPCKVFPGTANSLLDRILLYGFNHYFASPVKEEISSSLTQPDNFLLALTKFYAEFHLGTCRGGVSVIEKILKLVESNQPNFGETITNQIIETLTNIRDELNVLEREESLDEFVRISWIQPLYLQDSYQELISNVGVQAHLSSLSEEARGQFYWVISSEGLRNQIQVIARNCKKLLIPKLEDACQTFLESLETLFLGETENARLNFFRQETQKSLEELKLCSDKLTCLTVNEFNRYRYLFNNRQIHRLNMVGAAMIRKKGVLCDMSAFLSRRLETVKELLRTIEDYTRLHYKIHTSYQEISRRLHRLPFFTLQFSPGLPCNHQPDLMGQQFADYVKEIDEDALQKMQIAAITGREENFVKMKQQYHAIYKVLKEFECVTTTESLLVMSCSVAHKAFLNSMERHTSLKEAYQKMIEESKLEEAKRLALIKEKTSHDKHENKQWEAPLEEDEIETYAIIENDRLQETAPQGKKSITMIEISQPDSNNLISSGILKPLLNFLQTAKSMLNNSFAVSCFANAIEICRDLLEEFDSLERLTTFNEAAECLSFLLANASMFSEQIFSAYRLEICKPEDRSDVYMHLRHNQQTLFKKLCDTNPQLCHLNLNFNSFDQLEIRSRTLYDSLETTSDCEGMKLLAKTELLRLGRMDKNHTKNLIDEVQAFCINHLKQLTELIMLLGGIQPDESLVWTSIQDHISRKIDSVLAKLKATNKPPKQCADLFKKLGKIKRAIGNKLPKTHEETDVLPCYSHPSDHYLASVHRNIDLLQARLAKSLASKDYRNFYKRCYLLISISVKDMGIACAARKSLVDLSKIQKKNLSGDIWHWIELCGIHPEQIEESHHCFLDASQLGRHLVRYVNLYPDELMNDASASIKSNVIIANKQMTQHSSLSLPINEILKEKGEDQNEEWSIVQSRQGKRDNNKREQLVLDAIQHITAGASLLRLFLATTK